MEPSAVAASMVAWRTLAIDCAVRAVRLTLRMGTQPEPLYCEVTSASVSEVNTAVNVPPSPKARVKKIRWAVPVMRSTWWTQFWLLASVSRSATIS